MMSSTMRVMNREHAERLIREAIKSGEIAQYDDMDWETHGGQFIFVTIVDDDGILGVYELEGSEWRRVKL